MKDYDIWARRNVDYHLIFALESGLSHIGETLKSSNVSVLKQQKRLCIDRVERTHFVFSANAIRNAIFRRKGFGYTLDELGITVDPIVHHALFAGGRIDSSVANNIELDNLFRYWLPGLSVLGTAKPSGVGGEKCAQMLPGRLAVGDAVLVCFETAEVLYNEVRGLIPHDCFAAIARIIEARRALTTDIFSQPSTDAIAEYNLAIQECLPIVRHHLKPSASFIEVDRFYRRDSVTDPALQKYLPAIQDSDNEQMSLPGIGTSKKKEKPKEKETEQDENRFMGDDHLIRAGSQLYGNMSLYGTTVEEGFLIAALTEFAKHPYIGGKSNRGKGKVRLRVVFNDKTTKEKGELLDIGSEYQTLSDRAEENFQRYRDRLQVFREHLSVARDSMPSHLLGGV